jgi:hypothetical protein
MARYVKRGIGDPLVVLIRGIGVECVMMNPTVRSTTHIDKTV